MYCGNCGNSIPDGKKFCSKDGTPVGEALTFCTKTGQPHDASKKFCSACGKQVGKTVTPPTNGRKRPVTPRIKGTRYTAQVGDKGKTTIPKQVRLAMGAEAGKSIVFILQEDRVIIPFLE